MLSTELHNPTSTPALMVRLQAVRKAAGDRILLVIYEDNYIALLPNETRTIRTELKGRHQGQRPRMIVGGFNAS